MKQYNFLSENVARRLYKMYQNGEINNKRWNYNYDGTPMYHYGRVSLKDPPFLSDWAARTLDCKRQGAEVADDITELRKMKSGKDRYDEEEYRTYLRHKNRHLQLGRDMKKAKKDAEDDQNWEAEKYLPKIDWQIRNNDRDVTSGVPMKKRIKKNWFNTPTFKIKSLFKRLMGK